MNVLPITLRSIRRVSPGTYEAQLEVEGADDYTITFTVEDGDGVAIVHGSDPWAALCMRMNGMRTVTSAVHAFHSVSASLDPEYDSPQP